MRIRQKLDSRRIETRRESRSFTEEATERCVYKKRTTDPQGNPSYTTDWSLYPEIPVHAEEVAGNITLVPTTLISHNSGHIALALRSVELGNPTKTKEVTAKGVSIKAIEQVGPSNTSRNLSPSFVEDDPFSEVPKSPPRAPVPERLPTPDLPENGMERMWECCKPMA